MSNSNATAENPLLSERKKLEHQIIQTNQTNQAEHADHAVAGVVVKKDPFENYVYKPPHWYITFWYDCFLWIMTSIFDCFFREIRTRGAFRIPRGKTSVDGELTAAKGEDPIIFVAAPHANQFIDPVILMGRVKKAVNRRVSFLIAAKSLTRPAVGTFARFLMSIGVARPQDNLKLVESGKVTVDPENPLKLIGDENCDFTVFKQKGLLGLPKSLGTANIEEIINKNELLLKKEFKMAKPEVSELLTRGTKIKYADPIDQSEVYAKVFEHLHHGQCIGIFPEGGSHDRPHLLPMKPGVAIMALGAMAKFDKLNVKIVCCGMNYFHAHKFRSRAIVEFGYPIEISRGLLEKYKNPTTMREAVQELMEQITEGLKSVTINCPDYETLMAVQATRRLYLGNMNNRMPLKVVIDMNRRLVQGYEKFKDDERIINLKKKVLEYNEELNNLNIADHMVGSIDQYNNWFKNIQILISRVVKILVLFLLSLPGFIMFSPVFILAKSISAKKAKEALANSTVKIKANDVIATWKVLIGMGFAPILYCFWSVLLSHYMCSKYQDTVTAFHLTKLKLFPLFYLASCVVTYCALIFDYGVENFKSLRPIVLLLRNPKGIKRLQKKREYLSAQITELVNDLGPQLFDDFDHKKLKNDYYSYDHEQEPNQSVDKNGLEKTGEYSDNVSGYESDGMSIFNSENHSISHIPIFPDRSRSNSVSSAAYHHPKSRSASVDSTFEIIESQDAPLDLVEDGFTAQNSSQDGQSSSVLSKKILSSIRNKRKKDDS